MSAWTCRSSDGKAVVKIVPPRLRIPLWKGPGADSEEKHEPASDIDTVAVDSLKALDPQWPIREADLTRRLPVCPLFAKRSVPRQPHLSPTLAELHHETLDSGPPHGRRFGFPISCVRGRQDYRSGPRRLRRWFRMEAGGGHSPESWLLRTSCPGA